GLAIGSHGLLGKQNLYEHSVKVPLIFKGPGIPRNVRNQSLCLLSDLFPTICRMTTIPIPPTVEGSSLTPVLDNERVAYRDHIFFAYKNYQRGIRTADGWKIIHYRLRGKKKTQLFNLNRDPQELDNLIGDDRYHDKIKQLQQLMRQEMVSHGDFCRFEQSNWNMPE
ncbi:MAG: DUF4976 domain-containing protein, partial [bacterium]|nr:DUF4976 domain-containing protein [bacterium]